MASKKIIVTGTSRGIGFELVKILVENDHQVLALSRNNLPIKELDLEGCVAIPFDLNDAEAFIEVKNYIEKNWSEVDILINNAGALINKPFAETSLEEFISIYKINVFGVAETIKTIAPYMNKDGHVVNISSMGGIQGSMKFAGLAAYSSSKGAVITLTELLAEEYKETGPSFNVLALGAVQTEMLAEAFPDYQAPTTAREMAEYIYGFAMTGNKYYNGKVLQVSNSTP